MKKVILDQYANLINKNEMQTVDEKAVVIAIVKLSEAEEVAANQVRPVPRALQTARSIYKEVSDALTIKENT